MFYDNMAMRSMNSYNSSVIFTPKEANDLIKKGEGTVIRKGKTKIVKENSMRAQPRESDFSGQGHRSVQSVQLQANALVEKDT
jgi:hypothetical protein